MKKILQLLLLLAVLPLPLAAQMSVKEFSLLERDLTANMQGTSRISPQDGKTAALVKVVTTETDFNFDGGTYSLVGNPEYKKGEIWIYVPARAQKLTISHSRFGMLRDYYYPIPIESGKTYELVLDLGVGKYVTIQTSVPRSTVYLDGDSLGVSPIYNHYILFGNHKLTAYNDKMEGELGIVIDRNDESNSASFTVQMLDQSVHYGQVTVTTDADAEIYLNEERKAVGTWNTELREGNYVVETRRPDCDPVKTSFRVEAQKNNVIEATPPVPHTGFLELFTRPKGVSIMLNGKPAELTERMVLPVGVQTVRFIHKGYYDQEKEYHIRKSEMVKDTVNLKRVEYLRKWGFYLGASYTIGNMSGVSAHVGATLWNFDLQLSYMLGLTTSEVVNFYDADRNYFQYRSEYKMNMIGAKLGYQVPLVDRFGITPQVGMSLQTLSANTLEGSGSAGDGAKAMNVSLGAKIVFSPAQHVCLFVAPEYNIAMSKDADFEKVADIAGFSVGGFYCHIGALLTF